jgi:hypothetical protein
VRPRSGRGFPQALATPVFSYPSNQLLNVNQFASMINWNFTNRGSAAFN